jgi:hypothetical protein
MSNETPSKKECPAEKVTRLSRTAMLPKRIDGGRFAPSAHWEASNAQLTPGGIFATVTGASSWTMLLPSRRRWKQAHELVTKSTNSVALREFVSSTEHCMVVCTFAKNFSRPVIRRLIIDARSEVVGM